MLRDENNLLKSLGLALSAVFCWVTETYLPVAEWLAVLCYLCSFILAAFSGIFLVYGLADMILDLDLRRRLNQTAKPPAPKPEPPPEPSTTTINGEDIPDEFIYEFLTEAYPRLRPVRSYPNGSRKQHYAQVVTNHLVRSGAAKPAAGNRSALVMTDRNKVMEVLGWV